MITIGNRSLLNFDKPTYLPQYTTSHLRRHEFIIGPAPKINLTVGIATTLRSGRLRDRCSIPVMVNNFICSPKLLASQPAAIFTGVNWPELLFRQSPLPRPGTNLLTHLLNLVTCSV